MFRLCRLAVVTAALVSAQPFPPTAQERATMEARATELGKRVSALRAKGADSALLADVEIYHKALVWILRYPEEFFTKATSANTLRVAERGLERARQLEQGRAEWPAAKGRLVRAYRSRIDGSVQPYALQIPDSYDAARPVRLDVILHGRNATLNEVSFIATHDGAKPAEADAPDAIQLHIFGRTNNAFRWAGETDVFEALESVRGRYRIDPDRIVLRGFSMGGAGAWHLGLHHPDRWAAVEAGAGFTDTHRFLKIDTFPQYQERTLRIYDAVDYAANAWNLPMVAYGGEIDAQLQASVNIRERLIADGVALDKLRMIFLVGPQTPHRWHPEKKRESEAFLRANLPRRVPDEIRFVTYTTRFNRCFWITVDGLERHYERAEVNARRSAKGDVEIKTRNVTRLAMEPAKSVVVDGQRVAQPAAVLEKRNGRWMAAGQERGLRKRHGLQGPIDDAFMESFLCVKPEGQSAALDRFTAEFSKWMRADVRVKSANEVNDADIRTHHLALFGDASNNALIRRVAPRLPIRWDARAIRVGARTFDATTHTLALIYPNPLNPARYVVINSGHTYGKDLAGNNALTYPRLGDWAVLDAKGEVVAAGLFDDAWRLTN